MGVAGILGRSRWRTDGGLISEDQLFWLTISAVMASLCDSGHSFGYDGCDLSGTGRHTEFNQH